MGTNQFINQTKEGLQILNRSMTILPGEANQISQVLSSIEADMFSILVMMGNIKRIGKAGKYDDATVRFAKHSHEMAGKLIARFTGCQLDAIIAERKPGAIPRKPKVQRRGKTSQQKISEDKQKKESMFCMLNSRSMSPLEKMFFGNGLLTHERITGE